MIKWLYLFLLTFPLSASAIRDSTKDDICLEAAFAYGGVGLAHKHFVPGNLSPGPGVSIRGSFRIMRGFSLGMAYSLIASKTDKERMTAEAYALYHQPGYYTTVNVISEYYNFSSFSFFAKHNFQFKSFELEPYLQFGFPWASEGQYFGKQFTVRSKKMNSNITNTSTVYYTDIGASEYGVGLSLSKQLLECFYFTLGAGYNTGRINYIIEDRVTDVYGKSTQKDVNVTTAYNAWQLRTGIQIRFKYKDMDI